MNNIGKLFDRISGQYDRFNHVSSWGIDRYWRRRAIKEMAPADYVLDVAIGTADLSIEMLRQGKAQRIEGIDLSEKMMEVGKSKVESRKSKVESRKSKVESRVKFTLGSAQEMPYEDERFDAVVCAYGVRNFSDLDAGLREMWRVMKPGGQLLILEFSYPQNKLMAGLYTLYFKYVMTLVGRLLTKDKGAFEYFYQSVRGFIWGEKMCKRLQQHGFKAVTYQTLTLGISTLYKGQK